MNRFLPQILLGTALVLNAAANILIKYSATRIVTPRSAALLPSRLGAALQPAFLLGLMLFALNVFAYQAALRTLRISVAYPVMVGGGFMLILLASTFLFHEHLRAVQYAGIVLILAGILLVVR
jgi:multidrug transporter EmrE-like cation transporter